MGAHPYTSRNRPPARKVARPGKFSGTRYSQGAGAPSDRRGLFAAMRRYLEHRAMLGSTEQGLYGIERQVRDFILWADERGVTHPQQVSRAVLERYQKHLYHYRKKDGEPLSLRSQSTKLVPLKGFFKWLTRAAEIPANPASELDLPRNFKRIPRQLLSAADAQTVLALPDLGTLVGLRDRALMEVLYATGMRRMEVASLCTDDIDAPRCVVLIREGKGRKDRMVPLGERALHWVQRYLIEVRGQLVWDSNEKTLFLGFEGRALNPSWLSTLVAQYVKRAEVGKTGGCHLWRHSMATLMLEGGADIRHIQAMLGHADLSSTQIYTQVALRHLSQVHARTHPGVHLRQRAVQDKAAQEAQGDPLPGSSPDPFPQNAAEGLQTRLMEALRDEAEADPE